MFELKLDIQEFERATANMGAAYDQMPFAVSRALNDAVKDTREVLVNETWPQHVQERNKSFIGWALHTEFSTKENLRVEIFDQSNRAHLKLHADGGIKQSHGRLAIPTYNVKAGAHGVRKGQRPRDLANKVVIGDGIYQRMRGGRNRGKLMLMYILKPSATQPADVPFRSAFEASMRTYAARYFPIRMMQAMRTRR